MNALNRGNGAQASQLWLNMNATDRANLSHSVGYKQEVSREDLGREMLKHQKEEAAKNGDDQDGATDDDSQQVEIPAIAGDPGANGLSSLPGLDTMPQSPPISTIPIQ